LPIARFNALYVLVGFGKRNSSEGFAPIWNVGMLDYWNNGSRDTAILGNLSAESGSNILLKMDNIL